MPPGEPVRRPDGKFMPGSSGNRFGRRPGVPNKRTVIAEAFHEEGKAIAQVVIDAAKGGDMQACNLVLSRLSPPLRAKDEPVTFQLDPAAPLEQQGRQVFAAVATGELSPDTAKLLLECLHGFAALRQVDELAARIDALERKGSASARPMGGVALFDQPETPK